MASLNDNKEGGGKAKRKAKRIAKKAARNASRNKKGQISSLSNSGMFANTPPPENSGPSSACKDGNSREDCPEVKTTTTGKQKPFNPNKGVISNSRKVGSKRQREKQAKKDEKAKLKEETGKTQVGRFLSNLFRKKAKPKQRRHANTRFM